MTIHKKDTVLKMKNKVIEQNEAAPTSTSSSMATAETVEVVSSTNIVEESRQMSESESRNNTVEVTSASREVITDAKGNIIKVIETLPQTVQQSSSSRRMGQSSQDFIAEEQTQLTKQTKTTREIPHDRVKSLSESHIFQEKSSERVSKSVEMQSESESRSMTQQSISSSTMVESSSAKDHGGHRSIVVLSHDRDGEHAPAIQTSSRSIESTRVNSEKSEAITKDGQTVSSTTRIITSTKTKIVEWFYSLRGKEPSRISRRS